MSNCDPVHPFDASNFDQTRAAEDCYCLNDEKEDQFGLWGSQSWPRAGFPAGLHALKARAQAELPAP